MLSLSMKKNFKKIHKEIILSQIDKVFEKNKRRGKYLKLKDQKKEELIKFFENNPYPRKEEYDRIALQLEESVSKVENWFKHERRSKLQNNENIKSHYKKRRLLKYEEEEKLENNFRKNPNPSSKEMSIIARQLNFKLKVISNWFSYRRSKLIKVNNIKSIPQTNSLNDSLNEKIPNQQIQETKMAEEEQEKIENGESIYQSSKEDDQISCKKKKNNIKKLCEISSIDKRNQEYQQIDKKFDSISVLKCQKEENYLNEAKMEKMENIELQIRPREENQRNYYFDNINQKSNQFANFFPQQIQNNQFLQPNQFIPYNNYFSSPTSNFTQNMNMLSPFQNMNGNQFYNYQNFNNYNNPLNAMQQNYVKFNFNMNNFAPNCIQYNNLNNFGIMGNLYNNIK